MEKPTRIWKISKNLLVGLNTIFIVFGFTLLIYGIGGKPSIKRDSFAKIIESGNAFQTTSTILVIIAVISMALGLYGLLGITSYCKATTYITLLLCFAFMDILLGFYSSSIELNAKKSIEGGLINSLQVLKQGSLNGTISIATARDDWDSLQSELRCCGVYDYRDWYEPISGDRVEENWSATNVNGSLVSKELVIGSINNHYGNGQDFIRIPPSCFKNGEDGMEEVDFNNAEFIIESVFGDGCLEKTVTDLDIDRVQRVGVLVASIKIFAAIFAMILACHLNGNKVYVDEFV
ncbi:unnamed protein product [Orchesella dallaii]|uniref:Tetraspanin n=1 Tax=Orchesella dallaii TaxID=48710 RepID=A0ABP1QHY1_9HEXA